MSIQTDDFAPARWVVSAAPALAQRGGDRARVAWPKGLADYVGQAKVREQLEIFIGAAKKRSEAMDHAAVRPAGPGQDTLSHIIANELG